MATYDNNNNNLSNKDRKSLVQLTTLSDFKILTKLGEGAYSSVYKVIRLADMKEYALKKVKLLNLSDKERENALNEVRILASVKQKNVISYKEAFWDNEAQSLCIVMEYADNGDLFQKICEHQKKGTEFLENEIWKVFIQVVRALKGLHEMRIMHRDLKSANVFLYKDWTAKLGDMNVSKLSNYKGLNYTQTGTPYYASPEVWKDEPYDSKSDIWSLGCVLYEMITLKPPFRADDMQGLYKRVLKGQYQKIPNHFTSDLHGVINSLLQVKPQLRPSCDQILEMPAITKRIEKFFPEEVTNDKSHLVQEIKVPKNLMYLTDKLPGPNYEVKGKFYKNKSEAKLKLPKLGNSMILQSANTQSQAQLDYQLPQINNKNLLGSQISIQEQLDHMQTPQQQLSKRNLQQQQIIIQVKPNKDKKQNQVKVSQLHQQSDQKVKIQQQNSNTNSDLLNNEKPLDGYSVLVTPNKQKIQKQGQNNSLTDQQDDSIGKKSTTKAARQSQQSSRLSSAHREINIVNTDNNDQYISKNQDRISALSQRDLQDSQNQQNDITPPIINSKSPNIKQLPSKLREIQQNNMSRNQQQQYNLEETNNKKLTVLNNPQNSILQDDDSPSRQQYGYRYASLQPQKRTDDIDQTPQLPKLPNIIKKVPLQLQQSIALPQLSNNNNNNDQVQSYTRSLSPYRNPSLIQPINSKQDLHNKLKQSLQPKAQSSGKLPKLKGPSEQILRQLSNKQNYYLKGSPKLQNMYYRVANSYLKSYIQPHQNMNIVGNSVKNNHQVYNSVNSRSQLDQYNNYNLNDLQSQLMPNSYLQQQSPLKPRKITYNQQQKLDQQNSQSKMIQQTKQANQIYLQSIIEQSPSNINNINNNHSGINHALLQRPSVIKKNRLQSHHHLQSSVDANGANKFNNELINDSLVKKKVQQFQGLDGINLGLPKNHSSVLLKYQIQETKQQ